MGESFSVRIEPAKGVMPPNRIDLEAPTITLTDTKNGREREVYINDTLLEELQRARQPHSDSVVFSSKAAHYTSVKRSLPGP